MYSRTQNENGSYHTRCLYCFLTVASAVATDKELELIEERHLCPERVLSELMTHCRATEARAQLN